MNKTFKTILAVLVMVFGFGFLATGAALADDPPNPAADDLIVDFEQTPLFGNEEDNFLPGDNVTRWVKVTNNTGTSTETKRIATQATNFGDPILGPPNSSSDPDDVSEYDLSRALLITIREENSGGGYTDIYGTPGTTGIKTLFQFYENGETYLSNVSGNGGMVKYEFEISFPADKGDDWQGATTGFNIIVGFQGEEGIVTPPGTDPGGGSGGGAPPPGLIIKYEEAYNIGSTSAWIKWWTSYDATSRVIYCRKSKTENDGTITPINDCIFDFSDDDDDPPLYGFESTTPEFEYNGQFKVTYREIQLTGLDESTTYEYRCVSRASPPTVSRAYTFTTLALADDNNGDDGELIPTPIQEGNNQEGNDTGEGTSPETYQRWVAGVTDFVGDVLDYSSEEDDKDGGKELEEKLKDSEVRGAEDEGWKKDSEDDEFYGVKKDIAENKKESIFSRYWWWPFILALLLMSFFFWYRKKKKKEKEIGYQDIRILENLLCSKFKMAFYNPAILSALDQMLLMCYTITCKESHLRPRRKWLKRRIK